jgi:hypothetical protein
MSDIDMTPIWEANDDQPVRPAGRE